MGLGGAFASAAAKVAATEEAKNLAELQEKQQLTGISDGNVEILAVDGMKRDYSRAVSGQLYNIGVENSTTNVDYSNPGMSYNGGNSIIGGDISGVPQSGASLNFESSVAFMFQLEGDYSEDKNDRGGATAFGITHSEYDRWRKDQGLPIQPVKNISRAEAISIYHTDYWNASKCDSFPSPLNFVVFDTAVNSGNGAARSLLRKAKEKFGELTSENAMAVSTWWIEARREFYHNLVASDSSQRVFIKGWMNRMDKVAKFISSATPNATSMSSKDITTKNNQSTGSKLRMFGQK